MLKFKTPDNFKKLSNNLYINSKKLKELSIKAYFNIIPIRIDLSKPPQTYNQMAKKLNKLQKNISNSVYSNQELSNTSIGSN